MKLFYVLLPLSATMVTVCLGYLVHAGRRRLWGWTFTWACLAVGNALSFVIWYQDWRRHG